MPQFGAMGEVLMYHAEKDYAQESRMAPELAIYPDDERVQAALRYAVDKKWPFVVHIEFAAAGSQRDEFMTKFEALLVRYPEHPFALKDMGQLDSAGVRRLIEAHDNIHFITSGTTFKAPRQPWTKMFEGNRLLVEWQELIIEYPDRFILGFDIVNPEWWGQYYLNVVTLWRKAIGELPLDVAHAFAHGNAERLWHLQPAAGIAPGTP